MKYYAVTEDPNELLHYGVKGMKWGKHLFGDDLRPKSPAYKKALGKLRESVKSTVQKTTSSFAKSAAQRNYNKRAKEANDYAKAVEKAQKRISILENYNQLDNDRSYVKRTEKAAKVENKLNKIRTKAENKDFKIQAKSAVAQTKYDTQKLLSEVKENRKAAKNEKHFDKLVQDAREGRLKYGKLSDDQVRRVTERLALERPARQLGDTEKPKYKTRLKEAVQEGMVQGVARGGAAYMEERWRAKGKYDAQKKYGKKLARQEGEMQRERNRAVNEKSRKDIRDEIKQEAYEAQVREGEHAIKRVNLTARGAAKHLYNVEEANRRKEARIRDVEENRRLAADTKRQQRMNEISRENEFARIEGLNDVNAKNDVRRLDFDIDKQRRLNEVNRENEFARITGLNDINTQNDFNKRRLDDEYNDERALEIGRQLYEYGVTPAGYFSNGNGGNNGNKGNKKGGGNSGPKVDLGDEKQTNAYSEYYRKRVIEPREREEAERRRAEEEQEQIAEAARRATERYRQEQEQEKVERKRIQREQKAFKEYTRNKWLEEEKARKKAEKEMREYVRQAEAERMAELESQKRREAGEKYTEEERRVSEKAKKDQWHKNDKKRGQSRYTRRTYRQDNIWR